MKSASVDHNSIGWSADMSKAVVLKIEMGGRLKEVTDSWH